MKKKIEFLSENFQFLVVKFSVYLNGRVFVMITVFVIILYMFHCDVLLMRQRTPKQIKHMFVTCRCIELRMRVRVSQIGLIENTPIQIHRKNHLQKLKIFR